MTKNELIKELARMEAREKTSKLKSPTDVVAMLAKYAEKPVEYFIVITLSNANEVINMHEVTKGVLNKTIIHPREVFLEAIKDRAAAIIIAHNHPSGNINPSKDDDHITKRIKDSGVIIGIDVLDHIIISSEGYYSYKENGLW